MVEIRLEVLVVALTALLRGTSSHHAADADPVVGALRVNQGHEKVVLMLGPRTSLVGRHLDENVFLVSKNVDERMSAMSVRKSDCSRVRMMMAICLGARVKCLMEEA